MQGSRKIHNVILHLHSQFIGKITLLGTGPLLRNHNLGGGQVSKKGTPFLIQELLLFTNSLGKPVFFEA